MTALALALAATAAPAAAQTIPSPYRFIDYRQDLALVASYIMTQRGPLDLGPESGLAGGLQYTLRINDPMALSARVLYFPGERELIDTTTVDGSVTSARVGRADMNLVLATARLQFTLTGARTWNSIAPYVIVGAGLAFEAGDPGDSAITPTLRYRFGSSFQPQFGVGISGFLSERWALRLVLLDSLWQIETPEGLRDALDPTPRSRQFTHNLELSAGIALFF